MSDWWNDPPETPEPPECCDDIMDITPDGGCICNTCKKVIPPVDETEMLNAMAAEYEADKAMAAHYDAHAKEYEEHERKKNEKMIDINFDPL